MRFARSGKRGDLEIVASMTYDKGQRGYATMMGVTTADAAQRLGDAGADLIASNCGAGIANMIEVCREYNEVSDLPIWIKPNAGLPELVNGRTVYRETPDEMAARIPELVDAGAVVVGGCCGTTPEHIRAFRSTIDALLRS